MFIPKQLAIIGSTASGKTALSIKLAKQLNAYVLSLDSLSIYKEIDIVSAKPTKKERDGIKHFGIDYIYPNEDFNVTIFIQLYNSVYNRCIIENKNLIIVGGTSFYLKILIEGISQLPKISFITKKRSATYLKNLKNSYYFLQDIDIQYMKNISSKDRYRIEKSLNIYFETNLTPTEYFKIHSSEPIIKSFLPIYQIEVDKTKLRDKIALRTRLMIEDGLITEVCNLEKKYTRRVNAMKSIGVKETLAFLDGIYTKDMMIEKITINTARLAKRQKTFNNSQFKDVIKGSVEELETLILNRYKSMIIE